MPKSNISEFASSQIINGKVWVHALLGLSGKRGARAALGQPPKGLTHWFCYAEPDRRVHTNPAGTAVTDGASSSPPISIPASFRLARNAAKAAVQPPAPLPKTCTTAEELPWVPGCSPGRREDALLHPGRQDWVPHTSPGSRAGERHPPAKDATMRLTLEDPS